MTSLVDPQKNKKKKKISSQKIEQPLCTLKDVIAGSCVAKWKKRSEETTQTVHIPFLENRPNPVNILIGTSMFERFQYTAEGTSAWAAHSLDKKSCFNCSCGGDCVCNILYRLSELKVLNYVKNDPKKCIIMAGANDIECGKIAVILDGMTQIISLVKKRFPTSELHLLAMFPRISDDISEDVLFNKIKEYNGLLKELATQMSINFHDFSANVIDNRGKTLRKMFVDNVHFSAAGYDQLAKELSVILE